MYGIFHNADVSRDNALPLFLVESRSAAISMHHCMNKYGGDKYGYVSVRALEEQQELNLPGDVQQ